MYRRIFFIVVGIGFAFLSTGANDSRPLRKESSTLIQDERKTTKSYDVFFLGTNEDTVQLHATSDLNGDGIEDNDGGNGRNFSYYPETNTIEFYPERKRSKDEQPLYFYIKATDYDPSRDLTIKVMWFLRMSSGYTWAPRYARWSYDQENWKNTRKKKEKLVDGKGFPEYTIPKEQLTGAPVFFTHGYTRTYSQWSEYIDTLSRRFPDYLTVNELCRSDENDLSVKLLRISDKSIPDDDKKLIWIISRQHAFEVQNDVVMKGILDYVLGSQNNDANYLRQNAIIYMVPLMDADGAYVGTPGKMANAPDFNRVWNQTESHWNAVQAVKDLSKATAKDNDLEIFFDFHDPYPAQDRLEILHRFPVGNRTHLNNFRNYFKTHQSDKFGFQINQVGSGSTSRVTAGGWSHYNLQPSIGGTFEIGWDKDEYGNQYNWEGYISAGESFAYAMSNSIYELKGPYTPPYESYEVSFQVKDRATDLAVSRPVISYQGNQRLMTTTGEITFASIPPGLFKYRIEQNHYFSHSDSAQIENDTSINVQLTRKQANLIFNISDSTGKTGNIEVAIGERTIDVNSQGIAYFYDLPAKQEYHFEIYKSGIELMEGELYLELDTTLSLNLISTKLNANSPTKTKIYPNPAHDKIYISTGPWNNKNMKISIFDPTGRMVHATTKQGPEIILELKDLEPGVYFLRLENNEVQILRKFILSE